MAPLVDVEEFVQLGYVKVPGAIPADVARDVALKAEGLVAHRVDEPWLLGRASVYDMPILIHALSDAVRAAFDLLIGPDQWLMASSWGFPTRFPGSLDPFWHIDGDWFTHHLTSGEQVVTPMFLWQDTGVYDSPTLLCPGSHRQVTRLLAAHEPAGIEGATIGRVVHRHVKIDTIVPATGSAGDLFVCHPFLAHSINPASPRRPRVISNVAVHKTAALHLDDESPSLSPVEKAIVEALAS